MDLNDHNKKEHIEGGLHLKTTYSELQEQAAWQAGLGNIAMHTFASNLGMPTEFIFEQKKQSNSEVLKAILCLTLSVEGGNNQTYCPNSVRV